MLQIELYVDGVEEPAKLFMQAFDMSLLESKDGWRHLHHPDNYDIMLFDPAKFPEEEHWSFLKTDKYGAGVQIVIGTRDAAAKHGLVQELGYACSAVRIAPWGSTEFTFQLKEGYLIRVKQPVVKSN